jgi:hypothetical protein
MMLIRNERELFNYLKETHIRDLETCKDEFSFYDCYSVDTNADIELKCRKTHYDELLIEKAKYDNLLARALEFRTVPLYVNSTPSGIFVFELTDLPVPQWEERRMPKTTEFANRSMIIKVVGYLHIREAKVLEYWK